MHPIMSDENGAPRAEKALAAELVDEMQALFGKFPGYRTTHAKGLLVEGTFTPTEQAKTLSIASHFHNASTPVVARFSVGGGVPANPDTDSNATPKGIAIRFKPDSDTHTDLIFHSYNGFATRTGEDFLAFLQVLRAMKDAGTELALAKQRGGDFSKELEKFTNSQAAFKAFLGSNPPALQFFQSVKPNPWNYGTITYYEPNTHVLTNKDGKITNVRYRLDPADGDHLYTDAEQLKGLAPNYLEDDLKARFPQKPIVFTVQAHIADPTDVLDDATILYKSKTLIEIGQLTINKVSDDNAEKQREIAFSASPERGGVEGVASSADPLIKTRNGVYWISADQRRHER